MVEIKVVLKDGEVKFFQYASVDLAIIALGKMVGAPPKVATNPGAPDAPTTDRPARKGRSDKGQPREPYKPRTTEAPDALIKNLAEGTAAVNPPQITNGPVEGGTATKVGTAGPDTAAPEKQAEPGKAGQQAATPNSTPSGAAPVTPEEATEKMLAVVGIEVSRKALGKFGAAKVRELKPESKAAYVTLALKLATVAYKPDDQRFQAVVNQILEGA